MYGRLEAEREGGSREVETGGEGGKRTSEVMDGKGERRLEKESQDLTRGGGRMDTRVYDDHPIIHSSRGLHRNVVRRRPHLLCTAGSYRPSIIGGRRTV